MGNMRIIVTSAQTVTASDEKQEDSDKRRVVENKA